MPTGHSYNPWILVVEIVLAAGLLFYFIQRRRTGPVSGKDSPYRIELTLRGHLTPTEARVPCGQRAQLVIHRFDSEPQDELFEIEELGIYEILPALHTTIIAFNPQKCGRFPLILAGERQVGMLIVE